jgi:hypothetical protein|tara:strand:+ start:796 stop:1698 length:903 start_codon:yes stop_codon:yes gene_type:complete
VSGLLDKKSRILDFIITDIGRNEMTKNQFSFEYATFNDANVFYRRDTNFNQTELVSFEATSLPSDLLVTDLYNDGIVLTTQKTISGSVLLNSSNTVKTWPIVDSKTGSIQLPDFVRFVDTSRQPLEFQRIIGNKGALTGQDEFIVAPLSMSFTITPDGPIPRSRDKKQNINAMPNVFQDNDFKTKKNFKFLPPLTENGLRIFDFDDITAMRYPKTSKEVLAGISPKNSYRDIEFYETSERNNIIIQFFELSSFALKKLKIVKHESEDGIDEIETYFIGKTFLDTKGLETFIKLFTLIIYK